MSGGAVERVPDLLGALVPALVPGCDVAAVRATFARASAGYTGPRGRDGRRVTAITPSGVPFELSVTGGAGRSSDVLRYVTETGTGLPFFRPRLDAQREALAALAARLPHGARDAAGDLSEVVDRLFPDPGAVPARTRFATTLGVVHRSDVPAGPAGLKLYGNLRAGGARRVGADAALARLAERWPAYGELRDRVADLGFLHPHFAGLEVDADGHRSHKVYLRTAGAVPASFAVLARRFGARVDGASAALAAAGATGLTWRRPCFVCCEMGRDGAATVSVHLSAGALALDPPAMWSLGRALAAAHGGAATAAALDGLDAAVDRAGGRARWSTTVVGLGLTATGVGKVNVYVAPALAPRPQVGGSGVAGAALRR